VRVLTTWRRSRRRMADTMLDVIRAAAADGRAATFIVPVGPV
jgi:hypothetical protein